VSRKLDHPRIAVFVGGGETDAHSLQGHAVLRIHTERAMVVWSRNSIGLNCAESRGFSFEGGAFRVGRP
jgi:hypothetical protein